MQHQSKLKHYKQTIVLFIISLILFPLWSNAQCPTGETEVTFTLASVAFIDDYSNSTLDANWDYTINGELSGFGPFAITDTIVACVPDGEFAIVGCGDWMVWGYVFTENSEIVQITDDGSQNSCEGNEGCYLSYDQNNVQYVIYTLPSCDEPLTEPIVSFTVGCSTSITNTIGCTNSEAPNYNPCAAEDDGSCQIEALNNVCEDALPLAIETDCSGMITTLDNTNNFLSDLLPSCIGYLGEYSPYEPPVDIFYEITIPESGNLIINTDIFLHGIAIYDACNGNELFCDFGTDIEVTNMPAGETVILQVWKYGKIDPFNFCVEDLGEGVNNDECVNATQLCGTLINDSNENAFGDINDPGLSCSEYYENDKTVWYSFTADDSGQPIQIIIMVKECLNNLYGIYDFTDGIDAGVFLGTCDNLTEIDCSSSVNLNLPYQEDPGQFSHVLNIPEPVAGATYYVYLSSSDYIIYCNYDITTSTGVEACCGPDIILDPGCQIGADEYGIIVNVLDLGNNPSGYTVNGGEFPDITATGPTDIGPFPIGIATITLAGKDEMDCILTYKVEQSCVIEQGFTCDSPQAIDLSEFMNCDNTFVLNDDNDFSGMLPSCLDAYFTEEDSIGYSIGADNFFSFVVPPSGNFKIKIINNNNVYFAIYNACDNVALECVPFSSTETFRDYEPGDSLLLQVLQNISQSFSLCIEEIPGTPENDLCENAIPLCGAIVGGTTQGSTFSENDPFHSCGLYEERNIWYSFTTNNSGMPVNLSLNTVVGYNDIYASILQGNCADGFEELICTDSFEAYISNSDLELTLANPLPETTYYLFIASSAFAGDQIAIRTDPNGIALCCDMDFTIEEQCNPNDPNETDSFYIDIIVNDFGENPSGLQVIDGSFGSVTQLGSNIIGPFPNGSYPLIITGLDDPNCIIQTIVEFDCSPTPPNDLCENAIEISCNGVFEGTNRGSTFSETDDESCAQRDLLNPEIDNTVWYSFSLSSVDTLSNFSNAIIRIEYEGVSGSEELSASILSGSCGGPYEVEDCTNFYNGGNLILDNAIEGATYYIQIAGINGHQDDFTIEISKGVEDCPAPDITLTPTCPNGMENVFYVDVNVSDLGDNPNGFVVNNGEFPNITTTGITTVGPFPEAFPLSIISLVGVDNPLIRLDESIVYFCSCEIFAGSPESSTNPKGQYVQLPFIPLPITPFPTLLPLSCEKTWVTDLNDIEGSLVGVGDSVYVAPDTTTLYYGIFECDDNIDCTVEFTYIVEGTLDCNQNLSGAIPTIPGCPIEGVQVLLLDFFGEVVDSTIVSDVDLSYSFTGEDYPCQTSVEFVGIDQDCYNPFDSLKNTCTSLEVTYSYSVGICPGGFYTASLEIEQLDSTTNCGFLYWVTDINNPDSTIVSTEGSATFAPIETTRYYGIAACDNGEQCVGEVTIYVYNEETCGDGPIIIDPPPPPPPGGSPTDTIPPPPPPSGGDPGVPGNPGPGENDDDNFDFTRCENPLGSINTLDKYVCFGEVPNVTLTDVDIPTGKSLYYAYHNSAELSNSSFIYAITFGDLQTSENVLPCATTVYLSAFTAPTVSNLSDIDLSNSCLLSNTLEITYLCPVQIQVQEICNGNGTYSLVVTVTGGLPQVLGNLPFSIYGTVYKGNILHNQTFTIADLPDGSSYQIEAVDSEMCHDWVTGNVQCDKLPVELLAFDGEAQANGNLLKWSTATEINNDYFTIESSKDGTNFNILGTVKGSGNSSSVSIYEFLDRGASAGITYYRLSQTDFDGTTTIEALTEVTRGESNLNVVLLNTYPVPFNQTLNLQLYSDIGNSINVSLTDVLGKTLVKKHFNLSEGLNDMALSTASFPKGLYLIAIESNDNIIYQKVVKD